MNKQKEVVWMTIEDLQKPPYALSRSYQLLLRKQRKLKYYQIGRLVRYKKSDIDEFLDGHAIEAYG